MRLLLTAAILALFASPAVAQNAPPAGRLSCNLAGASGPIVNADRPLECRYMPRRGPTQRYVGTIRALGLDIAALRGTAMRWRVFGPYARAPRAALAGSYTALARGNAPAAGQPLVGGPGNGVRLQPSAVQGARSVNVALGVTRLDLVPIRQQRRR